MEKRPLSKPKRETTTLNEPRNKSFTEQIHKQEAARESNSSPKDLNIMQGGHGTRDRNLEVRQAISQRQVDLRAPKPRERSSNAGQPSWRPMREDHSKSNRSERSDVIRSQNQESLELRRKKISLLGGGKNSEESSSQQQEVTSNYLLRLANDARSLRLQHEGLQIKGKALDQSTSTRELLQMRQRVQEIGKESIEVSKERDRLDNQ